MNVDILENMVVEKTDGTNLCLNLKYRYILTRSRIHHANEISDVRIFVPKNPAVLDHVASDVEFLTVHFDDESGRPPLELFVKKQLTRKNCPLKMQKQMTTVLLKEGKFLMDFVPEMESFCMDRQQQKLNEPPQNFVGRLFPRTIFADEKLIIMENLAKRGFTAPHSDKNLQNFHHAQLVLQNLAKFQALTYLMIERDGGKNKFLNRHPNFEDDMLNPDLLQIFSTAFESAFAVAVDIVTKFMDAENEDKLKILKKYQGTLQQKMVDIISADSPILAVCHGNCCNSNVLFSSAAEEEEDIIFVDFKTSRLGSPNLDIGYFLFRCVEGSVRRLRWRELLKIYFDAFKKHVELMGANIHFTFQEFVADFVQKAEMGFLFAIFLLPGAKLGSPSEISDAILSLIDDYCVMKTGL